MYKILKYNYVVDRRWSSMLTDECVRNEARKKMANYIMDNIKDLPISVTKDEKYGQCEYSIELVVVDDKYLHELIRKVKNYEEGDTE